MFKIVQLKFFSFLFSLSIIFFSSLVYGQVPSRISYQGVLSDNNGKPVPDGFYTIQFSLYQSPTGGILMWSEQDDVQTSKGIFNVLLGENNSLSDVTFDLPYWLQITIIKSTGNESLLPRVELSSSAYSLSTASIQGQPISTKSPSTDQVLKWDGYKWAPGTDNTGSGGGGTVTEIKTGDGLTGGPITSSGTISIADNGVSLNKINSSGASNGQVPTFNGSSLVWQTPSGSSLNGPAGGDLSGSYPNPSVVKIQGRTVSQATPSADQVLKWNGSQWTPSTDETGGLNLPYAATINSSGRAFEIANTGTGMGISGTGNLYGIYGIGGNSGIGVYGQGGNFGLYGESGSTNGTGIKGYALNNSASSFGVIGLHSSGHYGELGTQSAGVVAFGNDGYAMWAIGNNAQYAGYFTGNVKITGSISQSITINKIDDPIDPANKILNSTAVQSPNMMNIYNGNVTTDLSGNAIVQLPDYFSSLNMDFRYQLTVIGQFAQAMVSQEIQGNQFTIKTDKPNVKASWQVTGIRKDPWAVKNKIVVEEEKSEKTRGYYLNPEAYGQPKTRSIEYALHPELMKQLESKPIQVSK